MPLGFSWLYSQRNGHGSIDTLSGEKPPGQKPPFEKGKCLPRLLFWCSEEKSVGKHIGLLVAGIFAYVGLTGVAEAACSSSGVNQITCTGGQAASVVNSGSAGTAHASTYPATLAVSGAPAGATIASLVFRLNGYTSLVQGSADVGIVLEGPLSGAA